MFRAKTEVHYFFSNGYKVVLEGQANLDYAMQLAKQDHPGTRMQLIGIQKT